MASINNYLNFKGNCREAMEFYKSVFGGELKMQTFGESPMADRVSPDMKDKVMHSVLENGSVVLMGSDSMKPENYNIGNAIILSANTDDETEANDWFEKLSVGGKVTRPMTKESWGGTHGALTDKFGLHWFINCLPKKQS